jgi:hypothetical protein
MEAAGTDMEAPPSKPRCSRRPVMRLSLAVTLRQRPKDQLDNEWLPKESCNLSGLTTQSLHLFWVHKMLTKWSA